MGHGLISSGVSWPQNAATSRSSGPRLCSTLSRWIPLPKLVHSKETGSPTAREVKGPDPSRDKVNRQAGEKEGTSSSGQGRSVMEHEVSVRNACK